MAGSKIAPMGNSDLERQKLELEIRELQLAWWKRPPYLGVALPVVLAVVGFLSVLWSGYFDSRKVILESQIEELRARRNEILASNKSIQDNLDNVIANYRHALSLLISSEIYILQNQYPRISSSDEYCHLVALLTLQSVSNETDNSDRQIETMANKVVVRQLSDLRRKIDQIATYEQDRTRLLNLIDTIVSEAKKNSYQTLELMMVRDRGGGATFDKEALHGELILDFMNTLMICKGPYPGTDRTKDHEVAMSRASEFFAARAAYNDFMIALSRVLVAETLNEQK